MPTRRQETGQRAEQLAAEFLAAQGLTILERNYRRRLGELDIIARDGGVLVIAEVRTRAAGTFGGAAASVDRAKQRRIIRATAQLLQQRRDLARLPVRFDVLVVSGPERSSPRIEWIRHAFEVQ
jgi:putative endonuclease